GAPRPRREAPGVRAPSRGGRKGAESAPETDDAPRRGRPAAPAPRRGDHLVLTGVKGADDRCLASKQYPYAQAVARKVPRRPRPLMHRVRKDPRHPRDGPVSDRPPLPRAADRRSRTVALDRAEREERPLSC